MSTTEAAPDDVVDLEPTLQLELAGPGPGLGVALAEGTMASLAGETSTLRRSRLAAAASLLAAVYLILMFWNLSTWAREIPGAWILMGSRVTLSALIAGLLLSRIEFTPAQVRWLEFALFGGLTVLVMLSQYRVDLHMLQRGDIPGMIAFVKNGVIQMIVLMFLYGAFLPNPPRQVFYAVSAMMLGLLFTFAFLSERTDVAAALDRFQEVEGTGANLLFLALGAGIAVFASAVLNGLRTELHQARKYGQYRLLQKLGEGGMGEVYLAEHQMLKRPCALKLVKGAAGTDPVALARFEREVQSAARLSHPNTIEIFDYGHTDDGVFYYVMEYLRGVSLADLIREEGPLPPGRVIYLFRQACAGLAEAHELGLVHRDLKPANLFVALRGGESDVVKVLDFGLVKITNDPGAAALTADMTVSGTPLFMAPEQTTGDRDLDARADIYALGAMMYCALTGQPPFQGESAFQVMIAHARDAVTPPRELNPDIPADLEAVVLRCLAKKPEDRFPTVRALAEALAACAAADEWGPRRADAWWAVRDEARDDAGPGPAQPPA